MATSRKGGGHGLQLWTLIKKNLLLTVIRKPLGFLILFYGIPLAMLGVLLSIPQFLNPSPKFGVAAPQPIPELAQALDKTLVVIRPSNVGADVDRVIETLTKPLDKNKVMILDDELELMKVCLADSLGVSNCFASVSFHDSPETTVTSAKSVTGGRHTWQYTIRVDPAKSDSSFDIFNHKTDSERTILPLQLAVDNAITGRNDRPSALGFTSVDKEIQAQTNRKYSLALMGQYYAFIIISCYFLIFYRFVTMVTTERESGMSQLIDSMGGKWAPTMRTLSWIITLDVITLPCYIVFGVLYWYIIFPSSSVGLLIGWQVLCGFALNSSVLFAAAFFGKARASAIYVLGGVLLFSIAAQAYGFQYSPPSPPPGAYILALLFPSSNSLFFTQQMILWQFSNLPATITSLPESALDINSTSYNMSQATMLGFLGLQIIFFPVLAILVEKLMHGISFKSRQFRPNSSGSDNIIETTDLKKTFKSGVFKKRSVVAADGVSLQGHPNQILCLAGPNGSGKTTTLHMIAGFIAPTSGNVSITAEPSQIGICPQRNTFWDNLTVKEHVRIWSKIKGGQETDQQLDELIKSCDLTKKASSKARTLSGGQKRKLQLACMFVGNSTVCLIDECTSGLDPLSRRIIWEILLQQRSKRSIVFTTHFLDEVEVLADHLVILSKGKVKCQGAVAELKSRYGNGYSVIAPNSTSFKPNYPSQIHQDGLVYKVPTSLAAAKLSAEFAEAGTNNISITGPQVEDVFLNVAEDFALDKDGSELNDESSSFKMSPSRLTSFWSQVSALYGKRFTILRRFWWPYFYVVAIPLLIIPNMTSLLDIYKPDHCRVLTPRLSAPVLVQYPKYSYCYSSACPQIYFSAESGKEALTLFPKNFYQFQAINSSTLNQYVSISPSLEAWNKALQAARDFDRGGIFLSTEADSGIIAFKPDLYGYYKQYIDGFAKNDDDELAANDPRLDPPPTNSTYTDYARATSLELMNIYSQMRSGTEIIISQGGFAQKPKVTFNTGIFYTIFFCLVLAIYPAAFVLYPAMEKQRMVRSVQYANGVRRAPLWVAYGLFDFQFIIVISIVLSVVMSIQIEWIGTTWIILPILILYGAAALLQMYIVAHFVSGPLKSFLTAFAFNLLLFGIAAIVFGVGYSGGTTLAKDATSLGISFGLFLIIPIGNIFRALVIGFNVSHARCDDGREIPLGSIYAYGGPILILVIQVIWLLGILVWIEGDLAIFRKKSAVVAPDSEKSIGSSGPDDVEAERMRVEGTDTDLLRILHLSKRFGSNQAVDDVTLGLPQSEVLALLGPNGAGKSTLVNMIQSDLSADSGQAFLCGDDSRTRIAQTHFGVCPQYDAMDMLTTRQQLMFYARIKGIDNAKENVEHVMAKLGLAPHAKTAANKLSGGNKRKLSLAVALIGTPPVLVLDEPTSAMDAVAKRSFWKIIQIIAPQHSILLTTHSMEEADTLATRAAIISRRLLAIGTSQALRQKYSNVYNISLILRSAPSSTEQEMDNVRAFIHENIERAQLERDMVGGQVRFTIPGSPTQVAPMGDEKAPSKELHIAKVITLIEENKDRLGLDCYSVAAATLESVFLSVVRANNVEEDDADPNRGGWLAKLGHMF